MPIHEEKPVPRECPECESRRVLVAMVDAGWAAQCQRCGWIENCWYREKGLPHP